MIIGVIFGIQNIRQYMASRKREAAILMLNSFQTNDFVRGLLCIFDLPDHASRSEVEGLPQDQYLAVYMVIGTWERLGILVYQREIDLGLVDDAYSGPIIQSWQKLQEYVLELRTVWNRDTAMEWFQWLAERMMERETTTEAIPAYVAHKNWQKK